MSALCRPECYRWWGGLALPTRTLGLGTSRGLVSPFFPALINSRLVSLAGRGRERKSPQLFAPTLT